MRIHYIILYAYDYLYDVNRTMYEIFYKYKIYFTRQRFEEIYRRKEKSWRIIIIYRIK